MNSSQQLFDWKPEGWAAIGPLSVGILVAGRKISGTFGSDEGDELTKDEARAGLLEATDAERVVVGDIDPYIGAGGYGVGFMIDLLSLGADAFAWGSVALAAAPRIKKGMAYLRERFELDSKYDLSLTAEGLAVLAVSDVCQRHNVAAEAIRNVRWLTHAIHPPEPRVELEELYASHTICIESSGSDDYMHVWTMTVASFGDVLGEFESLVPQPNATHWVHPKQIAGRRLEGLVG